MFNVLTMNIVDSECSSEANEIVTVTVNIQNNEINECTLIKVSLQQDENTHRSGNSDHDNHSAVEV